MLIRMNYQLDTKLVGMNNVTYIISVKFSGLRTQNKNWSLWNIVYMVIFGWHYNRP